MPVPHFAIQAGTRVQPRPGIPQPAESDDDCPSCKQKAALIERLRSELTQAQPGPLAGPARKGAVLMWITLGICAACLLFAIAAVMRR